MLLSLALSPKSSIRALRKMMPTAKAFAAAQIEAGADIIGIGDAICSQISLAMYSKFVKPLHAEIIDFIHHHDVMVKIHICGDINHLLPALADLQPDIVDIDWMVDNEQAYQILGPKIIRAGNLNPAELIEVQSANTVFAAARDLVEAEQGRPFILSGGCEITPLTPSENLLAMKKAAQLLNKTN
jgi:uroporphyrinogen-III decarboxylase